MIDEDDCREALVKTLRQSFRITRKQFGSYKFPSEKTKEFFVMMVVDRFFSNEDMKKLLENNFSVNDRLIYDALVRTRLAPSDQDRAKAIREFLEKVGEKKKP